MLEKLLFGRTGHESTRVIFGAAAFWELPYQDAERTLDLALKHGINHIDTAAGYRESEKHLGSWLKHHRKEFFLATKTDKRTRKEAKAELHHSLTLLQTDHVDLWQMHALIDPKEWDVAMGPGGALEAFEEARREGQVRHLGVTGHGLNAAKMHMKSLERFDFDSVLLPYNYAQMTHPAYAADFHKLMEVCEKKHVAVQTIKSVSRSAYRQKKTHNTWYAPLEEQEAINHAVHWVLSHPQTFLNTPADIRLLPNVLKAAEDMKPRPVDEVMEKDMETYGITPLFC